MISFVNQTFQFGRIALHIVILAPYYYLSYIVLLRLFDLHLPTLFGMVLKESPLSPLLLCHYIKVANEFHFQFLHNTRGKSYRIVSLIFILTGFYWKFVCTDLKFCDCLSKFGIFHIKIVFKTWMFFNAGIARILIFSRSLYFLWLK